MMGSVRVKRHAAKGTSQFLALRPKVGMTVVWGKALEQAGRCHIVFFRVGC
jgi:hypothetical protein